MNRKIIDGFKKYEMTEEEKQVWYQYMFEIGEQNAIVDKIRHDLERENQKNVHTKPQPYPASA